MARPRAWEGSAVTKYTGGAIRTACVVAGFPANVPKGQEYAHSDIMAAIALAESGGDTAATANTSAEYSVGVFQINLRAHPESSGGPSEACARQLECSAAYAYRLYQGRGGNFTDWTMFKNGGYRKYLPLAYTPAEQPPASAGGDPGTLTPDPGPPHTTIELPGGQKITLPSAQEWKDAAVGAGVAMLALLLIGASVWGFATGES